MANFSAIGFGALLHVTAAEIHICLEQNLRFRLEEGEPAITDQINGGRPLINAIDFLTPVIGHHSTPFARLGKESSVSGRSFMSWMFVTSWVSLPGRAALLRENALPEGSR